MKCTEYSNIESPYLQKLISQTHWEDRDLIKNLMVLRGFILRPPQTASAARLYDVLRQNHPDHFEALFREHSEVGYQKWVERNERAEGESREQVEREAARHRFEDQAEYEDWLRAGGGNSKER